MPAPRAIYTADVSGSERPTAPARRAPVAEQQASLRRVAVLVAGGADAADVFAAIAREVAQLLRPLLVQIYRWERDGTVTVVGTWGTSPASCGRRSSSWRSGTSPPPARREAPAQSPCAAGSLAASCSSAPIEPMASSAPSSVPM